MEYSKTKIGLTIVILLFLIALVSLTRRDPEVGSEAWCGKLGDMPKVEWTAEDVKAFTHYCVGRSM